MDKRTGESPMEFEWETRPAGDASSPFWQLGAQHDKKRWHPKDLHFKSILLILGQEHIAHSIPPKNSLYPLFVNQTHNLSSSLNPINNPHHHRRKPSLDKLPS
jgi:hypothetical protein